MRSPRFWAFAISAAMISTGIVTLNTHLIPMVGIWGISVTAGATLLSVCALAGIPLTGMALSQAFGQATVSRAFGLSMMMTLPFAVIGIQGASAMFVKTGSYVSVIVVMIAAFLLIAPMPYLARRRHVSAAPAQSSAQ